VYVAQAHTIFFFLFDCLVFAFDKTDMLRFLRVFRTHGIEESKQAAV
jgi:hypothetical protein